MKKHLFLLFILSPFLATAQTYGTLPDCPKSPNCVSTTASKKSKQLPDIPFKGSVEAAKNQIKEQMSQLFDAKLVNEKEYRLQFEVTTKTGKFIDEVDFKINENKQTIDFRSASRTGYYDFGANKRRMKKLIKHMR